MSALLTLGPCGTVQTGTGKVDPARKFKFTPASREQLAPVYKTGSTSMCRNALVFDISALTSLHFCVASPRHFRNFKEVIGKKYK